MVRRYVYRNPYCVGSKLSAAKYRGVVRGFCFYSRATVAARALKLDPKTVERIYADLLVPFAEFVHGELDQFPAPDDPYWSDLHFCIFSCPAEIKLDPVNRNPGLWAPSAERRPRFTGQNIQNYKEAACEQCPAGHASRRLNENYRFTFKYLQSSRGGVNKRQFMYWFIFVTYTTEKLIGFRYDRDRNRILGGILRQFLLYLRANPIQRSRVKSGSGPLSTSGLSAGT